MEDVVARCRLAHARVYSTAVGGGFSTEDVGDAAAYATVMDTHGEAARLGAARDITAAARQEARRLVRSKQLDEVNVRRCEERAAASCGRLLSQPGYTG